MYKPGNKEFWTGRIDKIDGDLGKRWHQLIEPVDLQHSLGFSPQHYHSPVFLGFVCDEGVRRNQGRIGAKDGPEILRKACASLASHFSADYRLYDAGDVICMGEHLEKAQELLIEKISIILNGSGFPVILGGGHEVAFPSYMGLALARKEAKIGIINIDAHFDLRKPDKVASSGTPFYQIADWCEREHKPFNYFCIGIHEFANTQALFNRALSLGVEWTLAEELNRSGILPLFDKLEQFTKKVDLVYLSIDMDCFDASHAPGVSALNPCGLIPGQVVEIINRLKQTNKLGLVDIAELNPKYDMDGRTAKLAARLIYEVLKK